MEQARYKVSVVTAVYNVEEYLQEMIESIIVQTIGFENVQLILIDDGSKDSSGKICENYALQYPQNIVVIHKENGGVSSARNEGLKYVEGEYINFTDADDMLESKALELMYEYLKENEEKIDLVAIQVKLLGGGKEHPLNYKFNSTKIVDLEEDYDYIQLFVNSTLIKKECFESRCFDVGLSYAEDAQIIVDILLDKMQYGVINETKYLYRKRKSGNSALDLCRGKENYYIPCMERFILHSLKNTLKKKGSVPQFVQYTCMYDLQWRLDKDPLVDKGVLSKENIEKYKNLIRMALQYITNKIVVEQKNLRHNYKEAILLYKDENINKRKLIFSKDDVKVCIADKYIFTGVGSYLSEFEFISFFNDKIIIGGYVRYYSDFDDIKVLLKQQEDNVLIEYEANLIERTDKCTYCMDKLITKASGFSICLGKSKILDKMDLHLCIRYKNADIICRNIGLGKDFDILNQSDTNNLLNQFVSVTFSENKLILLKVEK